MTAESNAPFRAALIEECGAEFLPRLAIVLEVARVYGHALECRSCRQYARPIASVFTVVARQLGEVIRGWHVVGVDLDDVLLPQPADVALLIEACRTAPEFCEGADDEAEADSDWRTALGLAGLAVARRMGSRTSQHLQFT